MDIQEEKFNELFDTWIEVAHKENIKNLGSLMAKAMKPALVAMKDVNKNFFEEGVGFAQKQAIPEGFVLVEKSKTEHWYLDEGENMWMEEPDYWLCDMDIGDVQAVKHKEYLVTESNTLYATKVWDDENDDVDTWQFFKSQDEAEKAAAYCKAKFWEEEVQEQVG